VREYVTTCEAQRSKVKRFYITGAEQYITHCASILVYCWRSSIHIYTDVFMIITIEIILMLFIYLAIKLAQFRVPVLYRNYNH